MLEEFQNLDLFPVSGFDIVINLIVALLCGTTISLVYRLVYRGASYSVSFVNALILLAMITSMIILVIGNNLARAFGLVGAMSIIRFRTAVRDVQDIVFIFFALSVGMAAGVGLHLIAIISTLIICFIAIVLYVFQFGNPRKAQHLLQFTFLPGNDHESTSLEIVKNYCNKIRLVNLKTFDDRIEAYYHVNIKNKKNASLLVSELKDLNFIENVNLFFDEEDTNPPL